MNERLINIPFTLASQADADGVAGAYVPEGFLLTAISVFGTVAGSPTAATIDVQDDGTDIVTAQDISSNGLTTLGTPVRVASGSVLEIDVNLTGGTSPTFTGDIVLWGYVAE